MELTTLLNRCYHFKGFVYKDARFAPGKPNTIEVGVVPRQGSKPYCSGCGKRRAGYDKLPERSFQFIPFWGFAVFFRYARRRVDCPACGVTAEILPWAEGKHHLTTAYMQFLATWARKLSWLEVSRSFHTSLGSRLALRPREPDRSSGSCAGASNTGSWGRSAPSGSMRSPSTGAQVSHARLSERGRHGAPLVGG